MGVSQCELPSPRRCPLAPRPPPLHELGCFPQLPVRYDIPEHRTFVEFGSDVQTSHPSGASTAPAAMTNCIRDSLDAGQVFVVTPSSAGLPAESSPAVMPGITYLMSPRSAMAWGRVLVFPQSAQAGYGDGSCVEACAADEGAASSSQGQQEENGDASDDDEEEDSIMCPVYSESSALPSAGSAGHGTGTCRRCCFFPKGRCNNGAECSFCHFAHERRKTSNAKKKKKKHKRKKGRRAGKDPSLACGDGCEAVGTAQVFLQDNGMSYVMVVPVSLPFCVAGHAEAG